MGKSLSETIVGEVIRLAGEKVKVALATNGCKDCTFQTEDGARFCEYSAFCFSQNRSDRNSVKFVKIE